MIVSQNHSGSPKGAQAVHRSKKKSQTGHFRRLSALLVGFSVCGAACEEDADSTDDVLLVSDEDAVLAVRVVSELNSEAVADVSHSVEIQSASGVLVGTAALSHVYAYDSAYYVPMAWGNPDADPATDFLLVTVDIQSDFVDTVLQVELNVAVSGATEAWCEPMRADAFVTGRYYLQLQPACEQEDRLNGQCVIDSALTCDGYSGACREDLLTFLLWDGRSLDAGSVCHDQLDQE